MSQKHELTYRQQEPNRSFPRGYWRAQCSCGTYDCSATEFEVTRQAALLHANPGRPSRSPDKVRIEELEAQVTELTKLLAEQQRMNQAVADDSQQVREVLAIISDAIDDLPVKLKP